MSGLVARTVDAPWCLTEVPHVLDMPLSGFGGVTPDPRADPIRKLGMAMASTGRASTPDYATSCTLITTNSPQPSTP